MRANTVQDMYREHTYNPMQIYETNQEIRLAMTQMIDGTLFPDSATTLQPLYHSLLLGDYGSMADAYFVLKDFGSYSMAQRRLNDDYADRDKWLQDGRHQHGDVRRILLRPHHPRVQREYLAPESPEEKISTIRGGEDAREAASLRAAPSLRAPSRRAAGVRRGRFPLTWFRLKVVCAPLPGGCVHGG